METVVGVEAIFFCYHLHIYDIAFLFLNLYIYIHIWKELNRSAFGRTNIWNNYTEKPLGVSLTPRMLQPPWQCFPK